MTLNSHSFQSGFNHWKTRHLKQRERQNATI